MFDVHGAVNDNGPMSGLNLARKRRFWGMAGALLLFLIAGSVLLLALTRPNQQDAALAPGISTPATSPPTTAPAASPSPSPSPTPSPTPTATPTATPLPSQRMTEAIQLQIDGQYAQARRLFAEVIAEVGDSPLAHQARFYLAQAYLADGHYSEAATVLFQIINQDPDTVRRRQAQFLLGEALAGIGEWAQAIDAYRAYLEAEGPAQSEAWERIGQAYRQLAAWAEAEEAYTRAIETAPTVPAALRLREELAQLALDEDRPEKALAQYDAILAVARNPGYRTEILYRAGEVLRTLGREQEAIRRYREAMETAPTNGYAHRALVALLDLGAPVDEYQRGLVNYYNGVYQRAVVAFQRYLQTDADGRDGRAYDLLARSLHALGAYEEAIEAWTRVIEEYPQCPCWGQAWLRRASAQAALGQVEAARRGLLAFVARHPQHELAAEALYQAARLLEESGDCTAAAIAYRDLQTRYPTSRQGAQGLFAAGMCMYDQGRWTDAIADWQRLLEAYTSGDEEIIAMTRLWLGKALLAAGRAEQATDIWRALAAQPETYYGQRALALAREAGLDLGVSVTPAPPPGPSDQEIAEEWLRSWLPDAPPGPLSMLPATLAQDPSLTRARELLDLGLVDQAIDELNRLRQRYDQDPLMLYRLALLFRDWRVYRLSIACAERLIARSPDPLDEAPLFIQRLAYPTYFADLIEAEATARGIDPLLIYALVRQESLFEAGATSHSAAHGLMQVIPATGEWIAGRLGWRDFRRELLYRPYVSIKFGTYYLWASLQMLDGNLMAALAGYNAGPGNAARWLKEANGDNDRFFAAITLSEPRLYVQRVLSYYATYRRLYGRTPR